MSRILDDTGQGVTDASAFLAESVPTINFVPSSEFLPGVDILVPTSWPDPQDHRLAYDRFGSGFYFILEDDLFATSMTLGQLQDLNNEDEDVALTINSIAGSKTKVFGVVFDEPMNITGYMVVSLDLNDTFIAVEKSTNTTNGFDGTWTTVTTSVAGAYNDGQVNPEYRVRVSGLAGVTNVKGIRIKQNNNTALPLQAMHFYGSPGSAATTDRLVFWDPITDTPATINNLNFGDCPRHSSADLRFRVKNTSGTIITVAVTLAVESLTSTGPGPRTDLQLLFSKDNARTFASTVNIGTLSPGQVSQTIYLRRVTPSNADLGTWAARVVVSGSGGVEESTEYTYMGDVSTNVPTPHIWYVYPPTGFAGEQVDVVGSGFGTSAAQYAGIVEYGQVSQSPIGWAETAAGLHAYDAARVIQSPNDVVNVEHQRITVDVPDPAVDDYFTVETNA